MRKKERKVFAHIFEEAAYLREENKRLQIELAKSRATELATKLAIKEINYKSRVAMVVAIKVGLEYMTRAIVAAMKPYKHTDKRH